MTSVPVIDPQALATLRDLNPEDPGFLRELIDVFLADIPHRITDLERALASQDTALLTRAAHTIKGSGGNFGTTGLSAVAQVMEDQGRAADFAGAAASLPLLRTEFARVAEALQAAR